MSDDVDTLRRDLSATLGRMKDSLERLASSRVNFDDAPPPPFYAPTMKLRVSPDMDRGIRCYMQRSGIRTQAEAVRQLMALGLKSSGTAA